MHKHLFFPVIIGLYFTTFLKAQNSEIDSLILALNNTQNDRKKVDILNELSMAHWYLNANKQKSYAAQAQKLASSISYEKGLQISELHTLMKSKDEIHIGSSEKLHQSTQLLLKKSKDINFQKGLGIAYVIQCEYLGVYKHDYASAISSIQEALKIFQKTQWTRGEGLAFLFYGWKFINQSKYKESVDILSTCIQIAERIQDKNLKKNALNALYFAYVQLGNYPKVLETVLKYQHMIDPIRDACDYPKSIYYLAKAHYELGNLPTSYKYAMEAYDLFSKSSCGYKINILERLVWITLAMRKFSEAERFFKEAIDFATKTDRQDIISRLNILDKINKGLQGNIEPAIQSLNHFIENTQVSNPDYSIFNLYLGNFYRDIQNYNSAENTLQVALKTSLEINNQRLVMQSYYSLYMLSKELNMYPLALQYHELFQDKQNEILGRQKAAEITQLSFENKFIEQEQEKKLLEEKNKLGEVKLRQSRVLIYSSLCGIALLLIIAYILWQNNQTRRKNNLQLAEKNIEISEQHQQIAETLEELKATQTQLVQSEKMASLGQLTAGIAHEINNPINYVYAGVDSLKLNIKDLKTLIAKQDEFIREEKRAELEEFKEDMDFSETLSDLSSITKSIKTGALRIHEIVQGLRTFSRLDEDDYKITDIHENLDSTLALLQGQLNSRISIQKEYQKIPKITANPGQLNQVFMNILVNAIQAIEGKGEILIQTSLLNKSKIKNQGLGHHSDQSPEASSSLLAISIKDSGKGMSKSVMKHIFEPFYTTKAIGEGKGLGLSISHSIIEKHQGKIEVNSEEGNGTEFRIILPMK